MPVRNRARQFLAGLLGFAASMAAAAPTPTVLTLDQVTSAEGTWVSYSRAILGVQVALVPDVDLRGARSLELVLESRIPTQLKLYAILPDGRTLMRYLVLSPDAMKRTLRMSLDAFDPEPTASWEKVPEHGALLVADVPNLRMIVPRGRLGLAGLKVSKQEVPLPEDLTPPPVQDSHPVRERMYGAWLGKALGGRAGMAGEGRDEPDWPAMKRKGWKDLVPADEYGFGPDDDSTLGIGGLLLAERLGRGPAGHEIAMEWMTRVSPEFQWKNGWEALRRFRQGKRPPETGQGPLGQCLDARIRATPWGLLRPGDPEGADRLAEVDAGVTSHGAGMDDARFVARALARAFDSPPLRELVEKSLEGLGEPYREAMLWGYRAREKGKSLEQAYEEVRERYFLPVKLVNRADAWIYSLPNAALMGLALAWGDEDPMRTLRLATYLGWDTDCNAGTLGALMGAWKGPSAFPPEFRASLSDRIRVGVAGREHWSIRRLSERTFRIQGRLTKPEIGPK